MLAVKKHHFKRPKVPEVVVDNELHAKLNEIPLLKTLNRSFFVLVLGPPGSGKSSLVYTLLTDRRMLNHVFDRVYLVMPASSIESFGEDNRLLEIPDERRYDELTGETLDDIEEHINENREKQWTSLLILDDVQAALKNKKEYIENRLIHLAANRRHNYLSIILILQNYKMSPLKMRSIATGIFCYNMCKKSLDQVREELLEMDDNEWKELVLRYKKLRAQRNAAGQKTFMFFNNATQHIFLDWEHEVTTDAAQGANMSPVQT